MLLDFFFFFFLIIYFLPHVWGTSKGFLSLCLQRFMVSSVSVIAAVKASSLDSSDECIVSLFKVKEVGVSLEDCSCLARDAQRIFGVYWSLGGVNASLPPFWPDRLSALSNSHNPLQLRLNGVPARVYLSVSFPAKESLGIYCLRGQELFCMWGRFCVCNMWRFLRHQTVTSAKLFY